HEEFGLYDPSCGFISDVEMWMRLSSHGDVAYVREPLIQVREREENHIETKNGSHNIRLAAEIHRRFLSSASNKRQRRMKRLLLELNFTNQYARIFAVRALNRFL